MFVGNVSVVKIKVHVKLEMFIRYSWSNVKQIVGFIRMEFEWGVFQVKDVNLEPLQHIGGV